MSSPSSSIVSNFPQPEMWKVQLQRNQNGVHNIRKYRSISSTLMGTLLDGQIIPVYEEVNGWVNVGIGWAIICATGNTTPSLIKVKDDPLKQTPTTWKCTLINEHAHNIRKSRSVDSEWMGQLVEGQTFPVFEQVDGWVNIGIGWSIVTAIGNNDPSLYQINDEHPPCTLWKCDFRALDEYNIRESRRTTSLRVGTFEDGQVFPVYEEVDGWVNVGIGWAIITPLRADAPHLIRVEDENQAIDYASLHTFVSTTPMIWTCILNKEVQHNIRKSRSVDSEQVGHLENLQQFPVYEEIDGWVNVGIGWSIITAIGNEIASLVDIGDDQEEPCKLYKCTFQQGLLAYNIRKERDFNSTVIGHLDDGQIFPGYEIIDDWLNVGIGWAIVKPLGSHTAGLVEFDLSTVTHINETPINFTEMFNRIPYTWKVSIPTENPGQNIRKYRSLKAPWVGKVMNEQEIPVYDIVDGWVNCGLGWAIIQPPSLPPTVIDVLAGEAAEETKIDVEEQLADNFKGMEIIETEPQKMKIKTKVALGGK